MQETDFPFEIILGEDGSTDGTREICQAYAEKHPDIIRLYLRSREDVIYIAGRPTGRFNFMENIRAARGKYIALCDGDDYWLSKDKLQKQHDFLEAHPDYVVVYHDAITVDEAGNTLKESRVHDNVKRDFSALELQKKKWILMLSLFFSNDCISFPPEFVKVPNADTFLISLLGAHGKGKYFGDIRGAYRMNAGSIWNAQSSLFQTIGSVRTFGWMSRYYNRIGEKKLARNFKLEFERYLRIVLSLINGNNSRTERMMIGELLEEHCCLLEGIKVDGVLDSRKQRLFIEIRFLIKKLRNNLKKALWGCWVQSKNWLKEKK